MCLLVVFTLAASVAASRQGMKTLLIEKRINLGGLATSGLISWYEPLCDGKGKRIVGGIAEELIKLCTKYGFDNLPKQWGGEGKNKKRDERYSTNFSPTIASLAMDEFVLTNGVEIRFDTYGVYPVVEERLCKGVICESADGRDFFEAKVVIDASGDACICDRAGLPTVVGENFMTYCVHYIDDKLINAYIQNGDMCKLRGWRNFGSDMLGNGHPKSMRKLTGVTNKDITDYVIMGKHNILERIKGKDKNFFDIMTLPTMPQFRTIRRLVGATDKLGVAYENCLVVEDSDAGIEAAKAGGMFALAVGSAKGNPLADYNADSLADNHIDNVFGFQRFV